TAERSQRRRVPFALDTVANVLPFGEMTTRRNLLPFLVRASSRPVLTSRTRAIVYSVWSLVSIIPARSNPRGANASGLLDSSTMNRLCLYCPAGLESARSQEGVMSTQDT